MFKRLIVVQFIVFVVACHAEINLPVAKTGEITLSSGDKITLELARTIKDQTKGLSGRKLDTFPKTKGMLFWYKELKPRRFWMPDTYFDLDIFFLDNNMKVTAIERDVKAHPGLKEPPAIQVTGTYPAKYVLEMRADSPISKKIKKGMILKLKVPSSP